MNCQMCDFFWSGNAHTYYGLLAIIGLSLAIILGWMSQGWLVAIAAIAGGVFVDEFTHGYLH